MVWTIDRRGRLAAFWAAYAAVTLVCAFIYLRIPPSPDQSLFDYMAWLDLNGVPFYSGTFDMTWPGQLVFHEVSIAIFGVHWWTARAGDFILLQPAVLAIHAFLRRAGLGWAAIGAALLYPIIYVTSGGWTAGHRDFTGMHFLIAAAFFALPAAKPLRLSPFIAGLLVGYATMIRPTYLLFAPFLFLIALSHWKGLDSWLKGAVRAGTLLAAGTLAPAIIFVLLGALHGTLHDWYVDSIRFVFEVYQVPESRTRLFGLALQFLAGQLWWLTIIGGVGALVWLLSGWPRAGWWLIGAMAVTAFVSYFVQNKGFGYHLAGMIPLLFILGCAGAEIAFAGLPRTVSLRSVAGVMILFLLVAGSSLRLLHAFRPAPTVERTNSTPLEPADSLALARIIQSESAPTETVLQWGWQFQVPYLAERRSPTRLVNTPPTKFIKQGQPVFGGWLSDFDRVLAVDPPRFILIDPEELAPVGGQDAAHSIIGLVQRRIGQGYVVRDRRDGILLLKRVADQPQPNSQDRSPA